MSCIVKRNEQGNIVRVTTPEGNPSVLFSTINSIPFMGNAETSLQVFNNAYSKEIQDLVEKGNVAIYPSGEPQITFRDTKGNDYTNMEDLILSNNVGNLKIGFKNLETGEFKTVGEFNTNESPMSKFLVTSIQSGTLSAERVLGEDGVNRFKGKGEYLETAGQGAREAQFDALWEMGVPCKVNTVDGTIEFNTIPQTIEAIDKDGNTTPLVISDIPQYLRDNKPANAADLGLLYTSSVKNNFRDETAKTIKNSSPSDLKGLANGYKNFLKDLGVSTTTIEEYDKNFNTRYGEQPDVNAFADIVNKVIAFRNGDILASELPEEVAHLAIETYNDQNSIADALLGVVYTEEYKQFNEQYRQKYSSRAQGIELEDLVRKEILGKILASELKNPSRNNSAQRQTLLDKLRNIWESFIGMIRSRTKNYHLSNLQELNRKLADAIEREQTDLFQNQQFEGSVFYYSLANPEQKSIHNALIDLRTSASNYYSKLLSEAIPNESAIRRAEDNLTENNVLSAINAMVGAAQTQIRVLEDSLKTAQKNNTLMSQIDSSRPVQLERNILPSLRNVLDELEKTEISEPNKPKVESFKKSIAEVTDKLQILKSAIEKDQERGADKIVKSTLEVSGLPEEQASEILEKQNLINKDTNWFVAKFGLMSESSNIFLKTAAYLVQSMNVKVNAQWNKIANLNIEKIFEGDWKKNQTDIIQKDENGKYTHYFSSPILQHKKEQAQEEFTLSKVAEILQVDETEVKKRLSRNNIQAVLGSEENIRAFRSAEREWKRIHENNVRSQEYYDQEEARYKRAGVSDMTRETIRNISSERSAITSTALVNGRVDVTKLTEGQKIELQNVKQRRGVIKSAFDELGNLREGLQVVSPQDITQAQRESLGVEILDNFRGDLVVLKDGVSQDELEDDARVSYDLNKLDLLYQIEEQSGEKSVKAAQDFISEMEDLENRAEFSQSENNAAAAEWMLSNSKVNLSDAVFEQNDQEEGQEKTNFISETRDWINSLDEEERPRKVVLLNQYQNLIRSRNAILRQSRKASNPLETDVNNMSTQKRERLLDIENNISETRRALASPVEARQTNSEVTSIRELNEDFYKQQKESGKSIYDFSLKHMTSRNRVLTEAFALFAKDVVEGRQPIKNKLYEEFIQKKIDERALPENLTIEQQISTLKDLFAQQMVGSYFQRFTPEGYGQFMNDLRSGKVKSSELIGNKQALVSKYPVLKYVEFTPDYTWQETSSKEEYKNPTYMQDGYFGAASANLYLNEDFFNEFGVNKTEWLANPTMDLNKINPTKNAQKFEVLKTIYNLNQDSLTDTNDAGKISPYQRPQLSADRFENIFSGKILNTKVQKDAVKDFFQDRKDEKVFGEVFDEDSNQALAADADIRRIPKYFQSKLESPEQLTLNTLHAVLLNRKQALLYKERNSAAPQLEALKFKVRNQKYLNNDSSKRSKWKILKSGEVSHYSKMLDEYSDYHLFGIKQSRRFHTHIFGHEVDLTKIGASLKAYSTFSNLAFKLATPLTSATTGVLNQFIDRVTGDYYHSSSTSRARGQVLSLTSNYAKTIATRDIKTTSDLVHIIEFLGLEDLSKRLKSSGYNRGTRMAQGAGFVLDELANIPIKPQTALTVMNDFRYSEGKFLSWTQFCRQQRQKNPDIKKAELNTLWDRIKYDSFFDNVEVTKEGVRMSEKFREKFGENAQEEFLKLQQLLSGKALTIAERQDGVLNERDQVAANRDVATTFFMQHRGWLPLALTRLFKKQQYSIELGEFEEGTFRSLGQLFKNIKENGLSSIGDKSAWNDLEDFQKRNVKRFGIQAAILFPLFQVLGMAILAGDDDDDTYAEDLAQLIYLRTVSEFNTLQPQALPGVVSETLQSPIPSLSTFSNLEPISFFKSFGEETRDGTPKWINKIYKSVPLLNRSKEFTNLQEKVDQFRYFNDETLFWLGYERKN